MIKSISLQNFQSHKSTSIDFCDGLNVIAGASDSGKSSVLRGMAWIIKNRPSGDAIRNWGCKKTDPVTVEMLLDNNGKEESLCKERIGSNVRYLSSEFDPLSIVGRDVPEEATRLLNLSDFNFQSQHDAYFLLNDSPGFVAKTLNDLVGLSIIDTIFKNINSESLSLKRQREENQSSINELQKEIDRFGYLDDAEKELTEIEKLFESLAQKINRLNQVSSLITSILEIKEDLDKVNKILPAEEELVKIERINGKLQLKQNRLEQISDLIISISEIQKKLNASNEILPAEKKLVVIKEKSMKLDLLKIKQNKLSFTIKSINESKSKLKKESEWLTVEEPFLEIKSLLEKQEELKLKQSLLSRITSIYVENRKASQIAIKKMNSLKLVLRNKIEENKVCPTCFRPLDKKTIERMIQ